MTSWAPVTSSFPPLEFTPDNSTTIDELFQVNDDPNIQNLIKMKEVIIDIITKRKEIDIKEINEDEDYKNEGVDQLVKSFQKILPEFLKLQDELSKISNDFEKEMIEIKKHMTIIDAQIEYLRKLPNDYNDDESMKEIIDQMKKYSKNVTNNKKIIAIKESYEKKIKETQKYIYLIRKLNNFNVCNMCPVCFTNQVDNFVAPCGHTYCKHCLESMINVENIYDLPFNNSYKCSFCREGIRTVRPLYFL